jgi:hypothetical protein
MDPPERAVGADGCGLDLVVMECAKGSGQVLAALQSSYPALPTIGLDSSLVGVQAVECFKSMVEIPL